MFDPGVSPAGDATDIDATSGGTTNETDPAGNPTACAVLVSPIRSDGRCLGAIEIFFAPDLSRSARQLALEVVSSVAELCADFDRRCRLRDMAGRQAELGRKLDALSRNMHRSLDLRETAYTVANDARQFIGCDRVTVLGGEGAITRAGRQRRRRSGPPVQYRAACRNTGFGSRQRRRAARVSGCPEPLARS